ncbi:protein RGF1 INDUCIBLE TRANSCRIPTION FACTOR 1-like isoform X2 [Salvia hispanica]|nr:protein RGF1 INDUCIBLE TRANSCRIPTION FACTOR 1-like isoform X2 [Salvia hispanica]
MFCLDCIAAPLCSLCLDSHRDHRRIQIRRSSYHDVIRVGEIQKFLDIGGVQTYIINSAKIVFLNQRRRPGKGAAANSCCVCDRSLLDSFTFCSIGCKIAGTSKNSDKEKMRIDDGGRASDSETLTGACFHKQGFGRKAQSFSPSTPPQTAVAKRRKGVPRRAPSGAVLNE